MHRRAFLGSTLGALLTPARAQQPPGGAVTSDVGKLRRVVVHAPGPEIRRALGLGSGYLGEEAIEQHQTFVHHLRQGGAEVLFVEKLLDDAIAAARPGGHLRVWLRAKAPQLAPREAEITGAALLGAVDRFVYHTDAEDNFAPLVDPLGSIVYTRDAAVMTPRGVVICNFLNEGRAFESALTRFAFDWAPALRGYPVVFDAAEERITLEGGDLMVADAKTLFLGVGNRSSEAAAKRLAQRLEMDVLAVQMPGGASEKRWNDPSRTPVHSAFLHLDTICTFVDTRAVVALPYLLERGWSGKDPLTRMLRGMAKSPRVNEADIEKSVKALEPLGRVKRYKAGSGEADHGLKDMKLADYLKSEGYRIIPVGGPPPQGEQFQHMAERVLRELRYQAANVIAMAPGSVIAYAGNTHTIAALRQAGISVETFRGIELARNNGGPHCMTMPLERL